MGNPGFTNFSNNSPHTMVLFLLPKPIAQPLYRYVFP